MCLYNMFDYNYDQYTIYLLVYVVIHFLSRDCMESKTRIMIMMITVMMMTMMIMVMLMIMVMMMMILVMMMMMMMVIVTMMMIAVMMMVMMMKRTGMRMMTDGDIKLHWLLIEIHASNLRSYCWYTRRSTNLHLSTSRSWSCLCTQTPSTIRSKGPSGWASD